MKRFFLSVVAIILLAISVYGQAYQAWKPNSGMGPLTFNRISGPYVKTTYTSGYGGSTQTGTTTYTGYGSSETFYSHQLITTQGEDPCRCIQMGTSYNYQQNLFPSWSGIPGEYMDTVVKIGCNGSSCTQDYTIEYWFYPQPEESLLLVYFTFAEQNAGNHAAVENTCPSWTTVNPRFYIQVLDGNTNQPIQIGYYKNRYGNINTAWPYSKYMVTPDGCSSNQTVAVVDPASGVTTYYWSAPEATPSTFELRTCPAAATQGYSSGIEVGWFEPKPLAFDLSSYANQNQNGNVKSVKLQVKVEACRANVHWAYGLFGAKMMPGKIDVDACGNDPVRLSVPWGMREDDYHWYAGYDSASASTNEIDFTNTPGLTGSVYEFELDRTQATIWPYYRCEMKSYTGVPFTYEAWIKSYSLNADFKFEQNYNNCDLSGTFSDTSHIYLIAPPSSQGAQPDTIEQATENILWYIKKNGSYVKFAENVVNPEFVFDSTTIDNNGNATVKIVIQDLDFKCIDSIEKSIHLDSSAIESVKGYDTVYTCQEKLPYIYHQEKFDNLYEWWTEGTRKVVFDTAAWNGCDSIVYVTLYIRDPKVEITADRDYCEEFFTNLAAVSQDRIIQYLWSTGETDSLIQITAPDKYSVEILNVQECMAKADITIGSCLPFMNLPNAITPNGDGKNDYFEIPQKNLIKELEFTVFNRNGVMVYHTTDKDFKWDGSIYEKGKDGKFVPTLFYGNNTYVYKLLITDYDGFRSLYKGSITVIK